jgi:phosphate transport system ATP-binding protein
VSTTNFDTGRPPRPTERPDDLDEMVVVPFAPRPLPRAPRPGQTRRPRRVTVDAPRAGATAHPSTLPPPPPAEPEPEPTPAATVTARSDDAIDGPVAPPTALASSTDGTTMIPAADLTRVHPLAAGAGVHVDSARPSAGRAVLAALEARAITAWFGDHHVLDRVSLLMPAGGVTALIGPSGCGKSTFLRILNRMHEMIPSARLAGEVLLDGADVYDPGRKLTDARRQIGMVFQKPNPFPAMSIYDNVLAGLRLTGARADQATKDALVEECLTKGGLWKEVRDRLRSPGGALSGGQQQRLCIARALAVRPRVLLMDEPCSALDPTSTRRIEETIAELQSDVTIVIVTHNMQQAARVSDTCAFFLAEQGTPGYIVEHGTTEAMFGRPQDPRTADYVAGRFG